MTIHIKGFVVSAMYFMLGLISYLLIGDYSVFLWSDPWVYVYMAFWPFIWIWFFVVWVVIIVVVFGILFLAWTWWDERHLRNIRKAARERRLARIKDPRIKKANAKKT